MGRPSRYFVGYKTGKLTIIKLNPGSVHDGVRVPGSADCVCDCGNTKKVNYSNLCRIRSCGCLHLWGSDLTGRQFENLLVLRRVDEPRKRKLWVCRCTCGAEVRVSGYRLKIGRTKICPHCQKTDWWERKARHYARAAKIRGLEWSLSTSEAKQLFQSTCTYCGVPPLQGDSRYVGQFAYNGIDRIDNSAGYTLDNCVACCGECNRMKSDLTKEDFLNRIARIYLQCLNSKKTEVCS